VLGEAGGVAGLVAGAAGVIPDTAAVTLAPDGATSHHFAPKLSLPCPLACPGPESPE
jgi:hypothetical protein